MDWQWTQDWHDCVRVNYGLDRYTPAEAMRWWSNEGRGLAPVGAVGALGCALLEIERLRAEVEALRDAVQIAIRAIRATHLGSAEDILLYALAAGRVE